MKFYDFFRSSSAHRVRIALNLKNVDCDWERVRITENEHLAPSYLALNPLGIVPTIVDDSIVIPQSIAIIEYLNELFPAPPLLPDTPIGRARVRSIALSIACETHPFSVVRVTNFLSGDLGIDDDGVQRWCLHWVNTGLKAAEYLLTSSSQTGKFCHGDAPTIADLTLVPQAFNAITRFKIDIEKDYPEINRIYENCQKIPEFANAAPNRQPDAKA